MIVDWTINVGNLLTIGAFLGGGLMFVMAIRADVNSIKGESQLTSVRLKDVEAELKQMSKAMVEMARQDERIKYLERRVAAWETVRSAFAAPADVDT